MSFLKFFFLGGGVIQTIRMAAGFIAILACLSAARTLNLLLKECSLTLFERCFYVRCCCVHSM